MKKISIDLETYSDIDISSCGVYRYVDSPNFEILLFAYSEDDKPVEVIDLSAGEQIPEQILNALSDDKVEKWAYNASFERVCLSKFLGMPTGEYLNPKGWYCSLTWGAYLGLPLGLAKIGEVLHLDKQKLSEGKGLIKFFCVPEKDGSRNLPQNYPDEWHQFKAYNLRDVETEQEIQQHLIGNEVPASVWEEYWIDQEINDRGVKIDLTLADSAVKISEVVGAKLAARLKELTGVVNPNSPAQLTQWLCDRGITPESLGKKNVAQLIKDTDDPIVQEVLQLRLMTAKSSIKKYVAMLRATCSDGRARGMFQFYGGSRTGRWAGRILQLQNLPQNHLENLGLIRAVARRGDAQEVGMLYDSVADVLSQLIRTAFVARDGTRFVVADFSAIEARVIAWYAGETWRQEVFANNGDIYCASASQMFHVNVVKHGENGHLRQKGKIAELALGFGGGAGALKAMGAADMGLSDEEINEIVIKWREASPHIVDLWRGVNDAAMTALTSGHSELKLADWNRARANEEIMGATFGKFSDRFIDQRHLISFKHKNNVLSIRLPSGRSLYYQNAHVGLNRFGSESIIYDGVTANKTWGHLETYGGKLVENIVQATARDLLCNAMRKLKGLRICMHIHDEVVIEADESVRLDEVCKKMAEVPEWAEGLILNADGYETPFYKKD